MMIYAMRYIIVFIIMTGALIQTSHAQVAMITECSHPQGIGLDLTPKLEMWHAVSIEQTTLSFIRVGRGEYDLVIHDKHGKISIRSHDPDVRKVFEDEKSLTIISAPPIGLVEVYQLSTLPNGQRIAIWNVMRNDALPIKNTNVVTYVLKCEDR